MHPILALGQGLIPLMAVGAVSAIIFCTGVGYWASSHTERRRRIGVRLMLSGMMFPLVMMLFIMFYGYVRSWFRGF